MSMFTDILRELDYPTVFLVPPEQFEAIKSIKKPGYKIGEAWGDSDLEYSMITVVAGMKPKARRNTIYHEIFHLLFPNWEHWRIELSAQVMAGGGGRGEWTKITGHDVSEVPSRARLLELARRAARRRREG